MARGIRVLFGRGAPIVVVLLLTGAAADARTQARIYASVFDNNSVTVVDGAREQPVKNVSVGERPVGVTSSKDGLHVYVANFSGESVSVLRTGLDVVEDTIPIGSSCHSLALAPDQNTLFVSNTAEDLLTIVDLEERTTVATIATESQPTDVGVSPDGRTLFIVEHGSKSVAFLDINARHFLGRLRLSAEGQPLGLAVSPLGDRLCVSSRYRGLLSFDLPDALTLTRQDDVTLLRTLNAVALSPSGKTAYVAAAGLEGSGAVVVVDTVHGNVERDITGNVAPDLAAISVSGDGRRVYATSATSGDMNIVRVDVNYSVIRVNLGGRAFGVDSPTVQTCPADCSGDGEVTADELVRAVAISVGSSSLAFCTNADDNEDGMVTVDELVLGVGALLARCFTN